MATASAAHGKITAGEILDRLLQLSHPTRRSTGRQPRLLREETLDGLASLKLELYDTSIRIEKILTLSDLRKVGEIPNAFRMEMHNAHGGGRTIVDFSEIKYDRDLRHDRFTQRALEHGL